MLLRTNKVESLIYVGGFFLAVYHRIYNSTHPQTPSEEVAWSQNQVLLRVHIGRSVRFVFLPKNG